jgi:NhaP-type Na+/H+ or K+/H+ antiporter
MAARERHISGDKIRLLNRFRQMDKAAQRKLIKFVWSGLLFVVMGLVLIAIGLNLHDEAGEGLLLGGFGAMAVIVGVIRLLIGVIRPLSPGDLDALEQEEEQRAENDLDAQLFEQ